MAFRFPECESCYFHNREPAICESCEDANEYTPDDEPEDISDLLKEAA